MKKNGFTLIEILVVATIIALLAAGAAISYSTFIKQSRDARRKADVEQIRAALEMYRSNDTKSSYPTATSGLVTTYIQSLPKDPKSNSDYTYTISPGGCDGGVTIVCTSYTVSATLEIGGTYTVTPYGVQ